MTIQPYRPLEIMRDPKITNFELKDFIGVWENFVPAAFCDQLIDFFEHIINNTADYIEPNSIVPEKQQEAIILHGEQQYRGNLNRKDISILLNYTNDTYSYQVNQFLKSCVLHYIDNFSQLKNISMISSDIKFQKTPPEGGYHLWHYENSSAEFAARELTWMIYLNDVPDGEGETEFLYQRRRIKPTKGTVVIFPCGMTHVHKGNTVFSTDKYILTGWYIKTAKF
jgi:hypothetical protein